MRKKSMYKTSPDRRKRQRGSALIEAGLTLVAFMTVLFGIMEFGRMVWAYNLVSHAAREASRYAMVHGRNSSSPATADTIASVAKAQALGLNPASLTVAVSWIPDNKPGGAVKVAVQYSFAAATGLVGSGTFGSTSQVIISQ
jgi:Flp pilus assembly protein TadG